MVSEQMLNHGGYLRDDFIDDDRTIRQHSVQHVEQQVGVDALAGRAVSRCFAAPVWFAALCVCQRAVRVAMRLASSVDARRQQCRELCNVAADVARDAVIRAEAPIGRAWPQRIFLDLDHRAAPGSVVSCGCHGPCAPMTRMQSASFRWVSIGSIA